MSNINRDAKKHEINKGYVSDQVHSQAQEQKTDFNQEVSGTGRRGRIDFDRLRGLIRSDYLDIFLKVLLLLSIWLYILYFLSCNIAAVCRHDKIETLS